MARTSSALRQVSAVCGQAPSNQMTSIGP